MFVKVRMAVLVNYNDKLFLVWEQVQWCSAAIPDSPLRVHTVLRLNVGLPYFDQPSELFLQLITVEPSLQCVHILVTSIFPLLPLQLL